MSSERGDSALSGIFEGDADDRGRGAVWGAERRARAGRGEGARGDGERTWIEAVSAAGRTADEAEAANLVGRGGVSPTAFAVVPAEFDAGVARPAVRVAERGDEELLLVHQIVELVESGHIGLHPLHVALVQLVPCFGLMRITGRDGDRGVRPLAKDVFVALRAVARDALQRSVVRHVVRSLIPRGCQPALASRRL